MAIRVSLVRTTETHVALDYYNVILKSLKWYRKSDVAIVRSTTNVVPPSTYSVVCYNLSSPISVMQYHQVVYPVCCKIHGRYVFTQPPLVGTGGTPAPVDGLHPLV